jgi:hypothetical protein
VETGPVASVEGSFTDPHHARIGMFVVLKPGSASGGSAQLTVFKFNSSNIFSITIDVPPGQLASFGEISSPIKNIAGFKMSGSAAETSSFMGVDNVTFDTVPDPCQSIIDATASLEQKIDDLEEALRNGEIPQPRTPEAIANVRAFIAQLEHRLASERVLLTNCRAANP